MPIIDAVSLIEQPEYDAVTVVLQVGNTEVLALGERINTRWPHAYMNGYNWAALIHAYAEAQDPSLGALVQPDPEAGSYVGVTPYSAENLERMRDFEALILAMLSDESALYDFIEANEIPWQ
ncbi:MAG: Imm51 family immunity protein [Actinomycetota bacterium]